MDADQQHHEATAVSLRRAGPDDQDAIKTMVREAHLDPSSIRWPNFIVAEQDGQIVGIGQVRPYPNCRELGSLVVREPWRGQGIAGRIIRELLSHEAEEVYLECLSYMAPYYARFGFEMIPWQRAPMPLWMKAGLGNLVGRLLGHRVAVMKLRRIDDAAPPRGESDQTPFLERA